MQDASQPVWDEAAGACPSSLPYRRTSYRWYCLVFGVPVAGAVGLHWLTVLPPSYARPEKNGISRTAQELSMTINS